MVIQSITEAIGHVPIVQLKKISTGNVFAKAEFLNPSGSIKDRVAKNIIARAREEGTLMPGMTIIEATSGNTGISLALVGAQYGYRVICIMPDNVSEERRRIIQAFGGETVLTPARENLSGCVRKMREIAADEPEKYFVVNQFSNPHNPEIHFRQTGVEIWNDMAGAIDIFIAGVGSGGTLQGIGRCLKDKNPEIKIIAVEPRNSAALLGREPGLHQIQGIGDGFIPEILDVGLVDIVFTVSDEEAITTTRRLSREEGLLVGTSSGANVFAALHFDNGRNRVVTVLPDRAERYFSTALI
jgi:cysteine synthase A